ncbi:hypothetical protein MSAN_01638300 [Mycena sanguinolenta]|uniref:DUF6533 domain-containing protein n=1 Tax=Mycena sanguinolenta TaxID=230812 RepID=A0A8H7CWN7_9AGAR|nr:hypothetical protein MSAN_01638300 [Mycena sanguinolenta]
MPPSQVYEFAFVCCSIAAVALLIWDWVITIPAEVQKIWCRKFSGSTVLYASLRYGTLFEKIIVLLLASWYLSPHVCCLLSGTELLLSCLCDIAVRLQIFPMIVRTIGYGLFSSLRVLALSQRNWYLAIPVFLMCLPSAIATAYVYANQESPGVDSYGCLLTYMASPTVHDRIRIGGIISDLLSEIIVIFITVKRTFWLRNITKDDNSFGEKQPPGVASLLLRNGTVYFIALFILSLADMLVLLFDHLPQFSTRYDYWVVPYYTPVFRTIIICRFLVMLRAVYHTSDHEEEGSNHSIHFASRIIGTMGAPMNATLFDEAGDEDEEPIYAGDPLVAGLLMTDAPRLKEDDLSSGLDGNSTSQGESEAV